MRAPPAAEGGFTLVELIVSLALFGLIAMAGLGLVDAVLAIQTRTDGRLDRLGELGRALYVLDADLDQIADAPLSGDSSGMAFRRHGVSIDGRGLPERLGFAGGALVRRLGGGGRQTLLGGVAGWRLRYLAPGGGWQERWPANDEQVEVWPRAVEAEIVLVDRGRAGPATLRRVVALPARR